VHAFEGGARFRLEPVNGFQPGARYRFRYLPPHGSNWRYPDQMSVMIDNAAAFTKGRYAIEAAPRPMHRVVIVPTSAGSCVEPTPAIVQEFTYAVPPSLAAYRDVLAYEAETSFEAWTVSKAGYADDWSKAPSLYVETGMSLGRGFSQEYTARNNAVIAACGARWPRVRLNAAVRFPEVDEQFYRTGPIEFDLNRNVDGQCSRLEALLQTIGAADPERVLAERCRVPFIRERPLRSIDIDEWERSLQFFFGMSPTCNLVALAYLWRTGQFDMQAQTLSRLGTALTQGLGWAEPEHVDEAVHALAYLVDQLPPGTHAQAARQLLTPMQPMLVFLLAQGHPQYPADLVSLLISSGSLPPRVQRKLEAIAQGQTPAAYHARMVLAAGRN
jgi:hypothetical protein